MIADATGDEFIGDDPGYPWVDSRCFPRIVACVNACAGVTDGDMQATGSVQALIDIGNKIIERNDLLSSKVGELTKQRDKLLTAAKRARLAIAAAGLNDSTYDEDWQALDAAIEACKP